jgi:putative hydrolase of the HAD superfamily
VDIREIHAALHPEMSPAEIEAFALELEQATNPVSEMPGAAEVIRGLSSAGIAVGLVSNAQFYTVPVLEECFGASLTEISIDPELCRFSYQDRRAKPDPVLFESVRDRLIGHGVSPERVLFVGNDVRNDLEPAIAAGFRTALFAGDARSLRLRGRSPDDCGADVILTHLRQLSQVVKGTA